MMQKPLLLDVLRRLPSMDVVRSGGPGKSTSVFIRGANSEHTLVLVDGIEMNDPVGTGRGFDFADLTTENILDLILKYNDSTSDIDNTGGAGGDDPNNVYKTRRLFLRAVAGLAFFDGLWDQKLGISLSDHERNNNDNDTVRPNDLTRSSFYLSIIMASTVQAIRGKRKEKIRRKFPAVAYRGCAPKNGGFGRFISDEIRSIYQNALFPALLSTHQYIIPRNRRKSPERPP